MSFYFRDRPKFGDRLRGKSGDEILEEIKQQFDEDSKSFFEPANRRDPFERNSTFPRGFPFDDNGFGRRNDIRAHLDDLAARHPELADHLLGPPWGDVPARSSFHNRNRDSGNAGRNNYQAYSDEDARSQASGSSAASGTSAASSHSERDSCIHNYQEKPPNYEHTNQRNQIPQYGLRNTVDIGQHHHSMDNSDKVSRGQRSMSAPPENRQSSNQQQQMQQQEPQHSQPQGQRYVSRIDITPQHNQPQQQQQQKPQQQSQQQQKPQQQSNVRHIPIFVEGRDDPVLPRSFDEPPNFKREPSPTQFQRPNFQSRSPFGQSFATRHHQWPPHFQDSFSPMQSEFEQPVRRHQQTHSFQQPRQQQYTEKQPQQQQYTEKLPQQQHYEQPKQHKPQQQPQTQQQQQQSEQFQQEPPKPKPNLPKDPMDRVALVQKEVNSLAEQVREYKGNSRTDKEYIYLDEMLTRELIKLDDIETEGRDNVRQARKNAIRTIQETISLLELKAPLPGQQISPEDEKLQQDRVSYNVDVSGQTESIEADQNVQESLQNKEPIPLPPGPSSPPQEQKCEEIEQPSEATVHSSTNDQPINNDQHEVNQSGSEPVITASAKQFDVIAIDVQQSPGPDSTTKEQKVEDVSEEKELLNTTEVKKIENVSSGENKSKNDIIVKQKAAVESSDELQTENTSKKKKGAGSEEEKEVVENIIKDKQSEEKMEVDSEIKQSPKSQKKGKKTRKQTAPVSDKPIPLPAPASTETSTK